ncbi:MAG: dihydroorotate dehydrogenase electron transfer subunit [Gemmatimonadota bacterium]
MAGPVCERDLAPSGIRAPDVGAPIRHLAPVVANRCVAEGTRWIELDSPAIAAASRPGQFLMLGYGLDSPDLFLLPRPFSVGWCSERGRVGILLRAFGPGTRRLATLRPGDEALLLGPLGRPFRLQPSRPVVCVAGGVGLAPFIFLLSEASRAGRAATLLYGERSAELVFDTDLLASLTGSSARIWTEDGSAGRRGRVTDGIDLTGAPLLLACGPTPMLRAVAGLALERELPCQVAVEEYMGCGIGTCQGCVVRGADGRWIKSCVEGPVFEVRELAWPSP